MKSIIKQPVLSNSKPYPKLMISRDKTLIVLFTTRDNGVIVHSITEEQIGHKLSYNNNDYSDYNESITLSND